MSFAMTKDQQVLLLMLSMDIGELALKEEIAIIRCISIVFLADHDTDNIDLID